MKKKISYDEISKSISLNSISIIGPPKSGKSALLNYFTKSYNDISRMNKINIIYRDVLLDSTMFSFVTCLSSLQTMLGQISSLQTSQICLLVMSINYSENIHHIMEALLCINSCKLFHCVVCITHSELYSEKFVHTQMTKLNKLINIKCSHNKLFINPITGHGINDLIKLIKYKSKQFWKKNKVLTNEKCIYNIIRSYDLTSKYKNFEKIQGGIVGGKVLNGFFKITDQIEIKPGLISKDKTQYSPILCPINNIKSDKKVLEFCLPSGMSGIELPIDPYYTSNNKLRGNIIGKIGHTPPVYNKIGFRFNGLKKIFINSLNLKEIIMKPLSESEEIIICMNGIFVDGVIKKQSNNNYYLLELNSPKCLLLNYGIVFRFVNSIWVVSGVANDLIGDKLINESYNRRRKLSLDEGNIDSILITVPDIDEIKIELNKPPKKLQLGFRRFTFSYEEINNQVLIKQRDISSNMGLVPQYNRFKILNFIKQMKIILKDINLDYKPNKKNNKQIVVNINKNEFEKTYLSKIMEHFKCSKCQNYCFYRYKGQKKLKICDECGYNVRY